MPPIKAQPVTGPVSYIDPQSGRLTLFGVQDQTQIRQAINAIPLSVSGEEVVGAGKNWTLANVPSGNVTLLGVDMTGAPVTLLKGTGNPWNFQIEGQTITTTQSLKALIASYEYSQ